MAVIIFLIMTIFGLLLSISTILMLAAYDTHENLKTTLSLIGMVLMLIGGLGLSICSYRGNKEKHTVVITTEVGEEIYTDCTVIITEENRFIKVVIETNDEEQIVYVNPIKYEVK